MPRQARIKSSTGIYHIILRGINRQNIFEEDQDKKRFIDILKYYKEKCRYEIYGYCLMDNHIHLLLEENDEDISIVMKRIGVSYVTWYNHKYQRIGHLFQGRYKSEVVEDDKYLLTVLRYIHQNPIKAGIVKRAENFKWSSYNEYINDNGIVQKKFILGFFSDKEEVAIEMFGQFMNEKNKDECLEIKDQRKLTDQEAKDIILKYFSGSKLREIKEMDKARRNQIIRKIKELDQISTRQIARITGISQSVISKI